MYKVIDIQTKQIISSHATLKQASRKVIKLDNAYGACRYIYKYQAI